MDYDIQRCTRKCGITGRELRPGEPYYSALLLEGAQLARVDYAPEAWQGPPAGTVGWWKAHVEAAAGKIRLAPNEVILQLFDELHDQPEMADMLYVLTLLLVRRRVLKLEETHAAAPGEETLHLYCPRRETSYHVAAVVPTPDRQREIQQRLGELLFASQGR